MVGLASLAQAFNPINTDRLSGAYLLSLSEKDDSPLGSPLAFQYFPETLSDTKRVNWASKEIPGGSLPIKQYVSSGDRTISFTAFFTCDVDLIAPRRTDTENTSSSQITDAQHRLSLLTAIGQQNRNVDLRAAVVWLRRHMLPVYAALGGATLGTVTTFAPRKVRLILTNSGIGLFGGQAHSTTRDSIVAIMTQCDVVMEAFFPSGLPRFITVNLAFDQVAQYDGYVEFPAVGALDNLVASQVVTNNPGSQPPQDEISQTGGIVPYSLVSKATFS